MTSYLLRRLDSGLYYKYRPYGNRWVEDFQKAKKFNRRGDAANALGLLRSYKANKLGEVKFEVLEFSLSSTGRSWEY